MNLYNMVGNALGSFELNIEYEDPWNATEWKKEGEKCVRDVNSNIHLNMWFNDTYKFKKNSQYNALKNFWRETLPSYIAGDGASFQIAGALNYDTTVKVQEEK